ncbi:hypothetical protein ACC677_30005, partial [Rhizobium ruizarguesonis]
GRGVGVKVITGDNRYVAQHLASAVGLTPRGMVTGEDLSHMTKEALFGIAAKRIFSSRSIRTRRNGS